MVGSSSSPIPRSSRIRECPVLGKSLRHLNSESVDLEIVLVSVSVEQLSGSFRYGVAHRDDVECCNVRLVRSDRSEIVRNAEPRRTRLPREAKARMFLCAVLIRPNDQLIAIAVDWEVTRRQPEVEAIRPLSPPQESDVVRVRDAS